MKSFNFYLMLLLSMFVLETLQAQEVTDTLNLKRQSELITPNHIDIFPILDNFINYSDSLLSRYDKDFIYKIHFTERNNNVYINCIQKHGMEYYVSNNPKYYFEYRGILFTLSSRFPSNVFIRTKIKKNLNLNQKKTTNLLYCIKDSNKEIIYISFHYKYIDDKFIFVDKYHCDGVIVEERIEK